MRGLANDLIRSYLHNRQQFVAIDGTRSILRHISTGVPQGSNIGPLLFLIYINDICRLNLEGQPRLFADDTALFYSNSDPHTIASFINSDLQKLSKYFSNNLLSLNLSKTKFMVFHSSRRTLPPLSNPTLGSDIVEQVTTFKYLGVYLDSTLSWDAHIQQVCNKASFLCGVLRRTNNFLPCRVLLQFYHAHIHSRLSYLILSWGRACKSKLKKLQTVQNRCIKAIFKLPHLYPSVQLYANLPHKILPIVEICELQTLLLVHDILNNVTTHHNLLIQTTSRTHNTRRVNDLVLIRASSSFGQKRFSVIGPSKFNNLPRDLQQISSRYSFKNNIKRYLKDNIHTLLL